MENYVTLDEYLLVYPSEIVPSTVLESASRDIDIMTFGRIARRGFTALTDFQRHQVKRAVCEQAHFCSCYGELLDSPLASYGINGVSMAFRGGATARYCGVDTTAHVHALLVQSGLAWAGL